MKILINKAHYPVTVLGPGRRIGIWMQGCSIRCPGCVSKDTWTQEASFECGIDEIGDWCRGVVEDEFSGVTISGGEPFDQPEALSALLDYLTGWRADSQLEFDILCYSGYTDRRLKKDHGALLRKIDAVIPGPFVERLREGGRWRGSSNQELVPLSERGRRVYEHLISTNPPLEKLFQIVVDSKSVWFVGIPMRGDMHRLEIACKEAGLEFGQTSWRA